jgi:hypothetical protein
MTVQIQVRRGTASEWTTANPILASGEIGFETDTLKGKIGNGSSVWSSLSYVFLSGSITNPMTTVGDTLYGATSGTATRLAGNTTTTPNFLTSTGTGSAAQAPTYTSSTGSGNVVLGTGPTISLPLIDNIKFGYTTTVTSASAVTLTSTSNNQQYFTGSTAQTVALPVTSTLVTGLRYRFVNNSTQSITVNSSGGNLVATILSGQSITITCIGTTLTTAADWNIDTTYVAIGNVTGLGTGVATALAINTGSAGAPVLFNGALGTPTSGTLTNATGLPISGLTASTTTALGVGSIELGHATDTTLSRVSAGVIAIEGANILVSGGALGTPSGGTLTNVSGLPISGLVASTTAALSTGTIELGHATDTTIARVSAGVISVEGITVPTISSANTLTNKSLSASTTWIIDNTDATKRLNITTSGNTTAITGTLAAAFTTAKTLTLPDATDTLVGKATADVFTNKTFNTGGTGNVFQIAGTGITAITGTGSVVLATSPTVSYLSLAAGTATAGQAPLKFTSGTNLGTAEAGTIEYDGTVLTLTPNTSLGRAPISAPVFTSGAGTSGITLTTNYALFPTAADTITLPTGTYRVEMAFLLTVTGSTVGSVLNMSLRGGGTATATLSWNGFGTAGTGTTDTSTTATRYAATQQTSATTAITVAPTSAATPRTYFVTGTGILRVTVAGTIIPAYQFAATQTGGTVTFGTDNYLLVTPLSSNGAVVSTGAWA